MKPGNAAKDKKCDMTKCVYPSSGPKGKSGRHRPRTGILNDGRGWDRERGMSTYYSTQLVQKLVSLQSPQGGINMGDKGNHHENKIRIANFEPEENYLYNGKQKRRKILQKVSFSKKKKIVSTKK